MRADQWLITASLDGVALGVFDKWTGGEVSADDQKYRPGGMQPHVSLGGPTTVDNVTGSRLAQPTDDLHALIARVGKGDLVCSRQALDADGNAFGRPLVYRGKLTRVGPNEIDSESNDAALLELE